MREPAAERPTDGPPATDHPATGRTGTAEARSALSGGTVESRSASSGGTGEARAAFSRESAEARAASSRESAEARAGFSAETSAARAGSLAGGAAVHSGVSPDAAPRHLAAPAPHPRTGVAALSLRYQVGAALALAVVAVVVCVHVGMVFLHVAPSNTITKTHGKAIDEWVYPEFEQNWKLFAPNPLQQNIAVHVRADIRTADGSSRTTGWYDLSAQDGRSIDGNLVPSHTQQNELRRAWDFYSGSHDADNRSVGPRSALSEEYLRRIVVLRLERGGAAGKDGRVERVQIRTRTTSVPAPPWSSDKVSSEPTYRVLPWWSVPAADAGGDAR
ncbi:DUF5819 family protein [Streptomyces canus]|uniref:DUF5819 family protein n=1 Tax=Streptomyces canus TaxID=58343 RepID=UPI003CE7FB57